MIIPPHFLFPLSTNSHRPNRRREGTHLLSALLLLGSLILSASHATGQDDEVITGTVHRGTKQATMNFRELPQITPADGESRDRVTIPFMPLPANLPTPLTGKISTERTPSARQLRLMQTFQQASPPLDTNFAGLGDDNTRVPPDVIGSIVDPKGTPIVTTESWLPPVRHFGLSNTGRLSWFWLSDDGDSVDAQLSVGNKRLIVGVEAEVPQPQSVDVVLDLTGIEVG